MFSLYETFGNLSSSLLHAGSFLWGVDSEQWAAPEEAVKTTLARFASNQLKLEECVKICSACLSSSLAETDYDLSQENQHKYALISECFNAMVEETTFQDNVVAEVLKFQFDIALSDNIKQKWADLMAKAFCPIPSISDYNEKVAEVEKWARQFYAGCLYFSLWKGYPVCIPNELVELENIMVPVFSAYFRKIQQQKLETLIKLKENNSTQFGYDELSMPLDKQIRLLRRCSWLEYTLTCIPIPRQTLLQSFFNS
jgi:hypothetical protein